VDSVVSHGICGGLCDIRNLSSPLMLHNDFYVFRDLQTGSGAHKIIYSMRAGDLSRG
jgi:hypothetical protein